MSKDKAVPKPLGDKRTIGITRANEPSLSALLSAGAFGSELDAAKFAMAHAIEVGTEVGTVDGTNTKWNVGTVDPDASLKALIESFYGAVSEPYRLVEYLINEGLRRLDSGDVPPNVVKLIPVPTNARQIEGATDDGPGSIS
jgi:hypothetical protein